MKNKLHEQNVERLTDMILTESNLEKAEIVLAVKGEIVDKLQRYAEIISNIRVDVLGPLLDRIKAESGIEAAEQFNANVAGHLDEVISTIMSAKDAISTETLKLTGDITDGPDIGSLGDDLEDPADLGMGEQTFDFEDDFEAIDTEVDDAIEDESKALEREMKESRKLGVCVESKSGTVGNKYFSNSTEMKTWLAENKHKINKVINILK